MTFVSATQTEEVTAAGENSQSEPKGRTGVTIRPFFLLLWAIVSVALLAEYTFTVEDLHEARHSRHHLALSLSDANPEEELDSGPTARIAELEAEVKRGQERLLDLQRERNSLQNEIYRIRSASDSAESSDHQPRARDSNATSQDSGTDGRAEFRVARRTPAPSLRQSAPVVGHVVAYEAGSDIVAIDLGRRSGLRRDTELVVSSEGREIGRIVVLDCRDTMAAGRLVLYGGRRLPDDARVEYPGPTHESGGQQ